MTWRMSCAYAFTGDFALDDPITEKAAGRFLGSGSDGCKRDLEFEYDNEFLALQGAKRVRPFTSQQGVRFVGEPVYEP